MQLGALLEGLTAVPLAPGELEIGGIAYDSRSVQPGDLFFALPGGQHDGRDFLAEAFVRGAVAAVTEHATEDPRLYRATDARRALAVASHRFFGDPTAKLSLAGVTGTAGKTTTSFLLESMLQAAGRRTGLVGTVTYRFAGKAHAAPLTTPPSTDLARMFAEMVAAGVETAVMEVTSHALAQHRATGCHFAAAAFTNMSREHLDYHADMEDYFQAKLRLFTDFEVRDRAAYNLDDPWATRARAEAPARGIGFGLDLAAGPHVTARDATFGPEGLRAELVTPAGSIAIASPLMGRINLMNILCAASLAHLLGLDLEAVAAGIERLDGVPGRMENVGRPFGRRVLVDFSHKVDALGRVLAIARTLGPGRLFTVFGCGGDRDQGKRPLMGRIAAEGSDVVILTSDNPRSEDPLDILRQIEVGVRETPCQPFSPAVTRVPEGRGLYTTVEDRRDAIRLAIASARAEDTVLICGKGHETQQIVGDTVRHFDDREEATLALTEALG